jgi:hypothetical protein
VIRLKTAIRDSATTATASMITARRGARIRSNLMGDILDLMFHFRRPALALHANY